MPFPGINQPAILPINAALRLRAYDGKYAVAVPWYQDEQVRRNSEGVADPTIILSENYVARKLNGCASNHECYFIEVLEDGEFVPIGDVTLQEKNPPIAIGVAQYRGIGIGTMVYRALVERARQLGWQRIYNTGAYEWNIASQKMLTNAGFKLIMHDIENKRMIYEILL